MLHADGKARWKVKTAEALSDVGQMDVVKGWKVMVEGARSPPWCGEKVVVHHSHEGQGRLSSGTGVQY